MLSPLTASEIEAALSGLPGWAYDGRSLRKTFVLSSFREAVSFIVRIAFDAEERDHHPELTNVYNRVTVALTTHDAGDRVTSRDVDLALAIEQFSWV